MRRDAVPEMPDDDHLLAIINVYTAASVRDAPSSASAATAVADIGS